MSVLVHCIWLFFLLSDFVLECVLLLAVLCVFIFLTVVIVDEDTYMVGVGRPMVGADVFISFLFT